jgi:hypothetical protein
MLADGLKSVRATLARGLPAAVEQLVHRLLAHEEAGPDGDDARAFHAEGRAAVAHIQSLLKLCDWVLAGDAADAEDATVRAALEAARERMGRLVAEAERRAEEEGA